VRLRGVEAYEGVFPLAAAAERELLVRRLFHRMLEALERIEAEDLFDEGPVLVTAGGTDFFDLAARMMTERPPRRPREYVIRSGCYLPHDDLAYERGFQATLRRSPDLVGIAPRLEPALEVWTCVQSMPEPGIALLTCGKRDISFDFDLPLAKWWSGDGAAAQPLAADHQVYRLNDQHAFLRTPDDTPLRVGDLVGLGVSHVCTTFDKWRLLMLVDDDYRVVGGVRTFF
jgi:D-serine dehydratase